MTTRPDSDSPERRFAENILRQIVEQHHIAYFAGGCVRDDLLGIPPTDYDIATSATPEQVQAIFGPHRTLLVGAAFGVICVHQRISGILYQVEVATFRSDSGYSDGRRPDRVDFTTPERDALRRDFTINGLFFDPIDQKVIDFVDGQKDLERGVLRAIGDPHARFSEDKLRLLRAVRIAARFQFEIESETRSAIMEMASQINIVSPERIAAEMRKMLEHSNRANAVRLLAHFGLLRVIFPEIAPSLSDSSILEMTVSRLEPITQKNFVAAVAVLCYPSVERLPSSNYATAARQLVASLRTRWRFSNEDAAALSFTLVNTPVFLAADHAKWSILQPLLVSPFVDNALHFVGAILLTDHSNDRLLDGCRKALALPLAELNPEPLVDGQLLMSLGLPTGPLYARLIKLGRAAQLDGELRTREEALEWARQQCRSAL